MPPSFPPTSTSLTDRWLREGSLPPFSKNLADNERGAGTFLSLPHVVQRGYREKDGVACGPNLSGRSLTMGCTRDTIGMYVAADAQ